MGGVHDATTHPSPSWPGHHPVATVLMGLLGAIAAALTVYLGVNVVMAAQQWSSYVGGEAETVLVLMAVLGGLTAAAWTGAFVAWRARHL